MTDSDQGAATRLPATLIPYCAKCGYEGPRLRDDALGKPFVCPNKQTNDQPPPHHAVVVKGDAGKFWLAVELKLFTYESVWSPMRFLWKRNVIKKGNVGGYLFARLAIVCIALIIADLIPAEIVWDVIFRIVLALLAFAALIDILLANTSVAFVSRFPANSLRSAVFTLISFATLTVTFAAFFILADSRFYDTRTQSTGSLDSIRAVYFSFVTITTLGYGEVFPVHDGTFAGYLAQLLVVAELICGLYLLLIVLATVASWGNAPPTVRYPVPLSSLIREYGVSDEVNGSAEPRDNP